MNFNHILFSFLLTIMSISYANVASAQSKKPTLSKNATAEEAKKYDEAKRKWIKENPEEYIRMGGKIEAEPKKEKIEVKKQPVKVEEEQPVAPTGPTLSKKDIPKDATSYKLNMIEIVENGVIDQELSADQKRFVTYFSKNQMVIYVDKDMKNAFINDGLGGIKKYSISIQDNIMTSKENECEECESNILEVIEFNSKSIILEHEHTNGGQPFTARYNFKT